MTLSNWSSCSENKIRDQYGWDKTYPPNKITLDYKINPKNREWLKNWKNIPKKMFGNDANLNFHREMRFWTKLLMDNWENWTTAANRNCLASNPKKIIYSSEDWLWHVKKKIYFHFPEYTIPTRIWFSRNIDEFPATVKWLPRRTPQWVSSNCNRSGCQTFVHFSFHCSCLGFVGHLQRNPTLLRIINYCGEWATSLLVLDGYLTLELVELVELMTAARRGCLIVVVAM